ncbi:MAG TPA: sensor histidine kinase [Actinophytocola sp.]|nr:sensor histidine kinase [Actinophytocola sp.]
MTTAGPRRSSRGFGGYRLPPFAIVIPIAFIQFIGTYPAAYLQGEKHLVNGLTVLLVLAGPPFLLLRRSHPLLTLLATVVVTVVYLLLHFPFGPVFLAPVIAAFNAVLHGPRLVAWLSCAAALGVVLTVADLTKDTYAAGLAEIGFGVAWLTLILVFAEIVKVRHERAEQAAQALEEQGRRRASEERLKIAREVHDVLAHHVSLINVQSGVALHLLDEQPEQARQALSAIKQSSKEVLVELRTILGVLKDVDGDSDGAPRQPVASLDQLDRLLERMREAGLPVTLEVTGTRRQLPSGVDAAGLRIVQESLTNTYRHAGPTQATVRLGYLPGELSVEVLDNGRGGAHSISAEGSGNGLTGMRQRAEALGGTLSAGPRPAGGFRVAATLPTGSTGGIEDES